MSRGRLRHALALGVVTTSGVGVLVLGGSSPAIAKQPDVTGWWNAANLGDPEPTPPAPPDVKDGDLLVQGSNTGPAAPLSPAPASSQAIAALSFDLAPTDLVGALTLHIDGSPPPQVSVTACRTSDTFTSTQNGPWSQAPSYDAKACVAGALKGDAVVFASMSRFVSNARLAVVLLPGPLDRVVFAPPGPDALAVEHGTGVGAAAPPLGSGVGGGGTAAKGTPKTIAPPASSGGPAPTTPDLPPPATTGSAGVPQSPVVAGQQPSSAGAPATRAVAASSGLSTGARRAIALVVIGLEVLGYLLLLRSPAPSPAPAVAVAGGRLRPPDRISGGPRAGAFGGVGRFRRERTGAAPRL